MDELVWYAGYGSNLNTHRFYHYMKGGVLEITGRDHPGSQDRSLPIKQSSIFINHELYFAKNSPPWEAKAVAFLKSIPTENKATPCVIYLVTKRQFIDIMIQENGEKPPCSEITPDFYAAKRGEDSHIGSSKKYEWYGRLLYLGEHEEYPIYSFTSKVADEAIIPSEPGANYLQVIGNGLISNIGMTIEDASKYLLTKSGVAKSTWTLERIKQLFNGN